METAGRDPGSVDIAFACTAGGNPAKDTFNVDAHLEGIDRLAGLGKPVLVIWGERDVLTPTAGNVARYTEAGLPPHVIAGSGHSPMVEKPDEFVSAIKDFVS